MAVSEDRIYTGEYVYRLLEGVKGKTLGEVDSSHQFKRAEQSPKITGIAGDVIEQSVFGYNRDSDQECDIEIDGVLTELKTTGVRVPKKDLKLAQGKIGDEYNVYLGAKEGISITGVTFEPSIQTDFPTSHFWEKSEHLLIVFYEYKSYDVVPAADYANFQIVDYCYNTFSEEETAKLRRDWEIVRDYLQPIYANYPDKEERDSQLVGFTHALRPNLLLIELVPGFKRRASGSYQKPRYRLKQTFVDYIVRGHFDKSRKYSEIALKESFSSFAELDARCHALTELYGGKTIGELQKLLQIPARSKNIGARCIIRMFDAECNDLNDISDFSKVGIIAKTITITPKEMRTEDMKLEHIDFGEWNDKDMDFEESAVYNYFSEHSFLCPIFCEHDATNPDKTTFEGFKRFAFDESFIEEDVRSTWDDSRKLVHENKLVWNFLYDKNGNKRKNKSGSYMGAPNFPKSADYTVFFRGSGIDSSDKYKTEVVNGINMLPQYFWIKGLYIVEKLKALPYL